MIFILILFQFQGEQQKEVVSNDQLRPEMPAVAKSDLDSNNENMWNDDRVYSDDMGSDSNKIADDISDGCVDGNDVDTLKNLSCGKIKNVKALSSLSNNNIVQRKVKKRCVKLKTNRKKSTISTINFDNIRYDKDKKVFICEVCSKSYDSRKQMRRHQITHGANKRYNCEVCHKQFHFKGNLQVHERIHTGERPFLCNTCGKSFIQVNFNILLC